MKKITPQGTSVYVYDAAGQMIAEYSDAPAAGPGRTQYMSADHLGTLRMWTNQQGAVISRHDYLPFGEELFSGIGSRSGALSYPLSAQSDGQRNQFTQKERDTETGLDYFLARYYSSEYGRFTSADSFGGWILNPQTLNLYTYVGNNPLLYIDPLGHEWVNSNGDRLCGPDGEDPRNQEIPADKIKLSANNVVSRSDGKPIVEETIEIRDKLPSAGQARRTRGADAVSRIGASAVAGPDSRSIDFYNAQVSIAIPKLPWLSYTFGITIDKYGNLYVQPVGVGVGKTLWVAGGSLTASQLFRGNDPANQSEQNLIDFNQGVSSNFTIGVGPGAQYTWSGLPLNSSERVGVGIGVMTPQAGLGVGYSIHVGNLDILKRILWK